VIVGVGQAGWPAVVAVATDHPRTRYVTWEAYAEELPPNVTDLTFRANEAAFLAGAAAARTSTTRVLGFVGAWRLPVIDAYLAGYEAGARWIDPDIEVRATSLAEWPDLSGAKTPQLGAAKAARLYAAGADVILSVARESSWGVFDAAASGSTATGLKLWAIGADTDEYLSVVERVDEMPAGWDPMSWQPHILTSVMKRLDEAFYIVVADHARGSLAPGSRSLGVAEGGVGLSTSNPAIDDVRPQLEELERLIRDGAIEVPTEPSDDVVWEP
jgi:basic membrane protein A